MTKEVPCPVSESFDSFRLCDTPSIIGGGTTYDSIIYTWVLLGGVCLPEDLSRAHLSQLIAMQLFRRGNFEGRRPVGRVDPINAADACGIIWSIRPLGAACVVSFCAGFTHAYTQQSWKWTSAP